jgi:hypothetical protein
MQNTIAWMGTGGSTSSREDLLAGTLGMMVAPKKSTWHRFGFEDVLYDDMQAKLQEVCAQCPAAT